MLLLVLTEVKPALTAEPRRVPRVVLKVGEVLSLETRLEAIGVDSCDVQTDFDGSVFDQVSGQQQTKLGPGNHQVNLAWTLTAKAPSEETMITVTANSNAGPRELVIPVEVQP